jgi:uncharacterized protein YnzC (UPF0291/DUF896 family)
MLVALITILFLGGGIEDAVLDYVKYTRGNVKEIVADNERQSDAQATLKEMRKLTKDYAKSNRKTFKSLLSAIDSIDAEIDVVDSIWSDYAQSVDEYNAQMIDLRFRLRDSLTREEWQAVFADPGK